MVTELYPQRKKTLFLLPSSSEATLPYLLLCIKLKPILCSAVKWAGEQNSAVAFTIYCIAYKLEKKAEKYQYILKLY